MPDQPMTTADHRGQLRQLLAHAGSYAQALDDIGQADPRREADVISQISVWHNQLGTALLRIMTTGSAGEPISVWEWCARTFEPAAEPAAGAARP